MAPSAASSWKLQYQHGAFVIWPPDTLRRQINELRRVHDPRSHGYCEAHITLTSPLKRELTDSDRKQLEAAFRETPPFAISLGSLATFPSSKVVYVEVEPQAPVRELRERLLATGLFLPPSYPAFTAHCTISEFGTETEAETRALLESLKSTDLSGSWQCSSAALIVPDEHFTFAEKQSFQLGKACQS